MHRRTRSMSVLALGLTFAIGLRASAQAPPPAAQTPPPAPTPPAQRPAEPPAHGGPEAPPPPPRPQGQQEAPRFPAHQRPLASAAVLERGKAQYAGLCSACHGADARGGQLGGPNLLRSQLVLDDKDGELIIPVVKNGRPGRRRCRRSRWPTTTSRRSPPTSTACRRREQPGRPAARAGSAELDILVGDAQGRRAFFGSQLRDLPFADGRSPGHRDPRQQPEGAAEPVGVRRPRHRRGAGRRPPAGPPKPVDGHRDARRPARRSRAGCCGSTTSS